MTGCLSGHAQADVPRECFQLETPEGTVLARHARVAASWLARMVGLLGRRELPQGEALVFPACNSIHTFGMRFPIDVLFVDRGWRVVAVRETLPPGRMVWPIWKAWGVVELPSGTLSRVGVAVGDQLRQASGCQGASASR